MHSLPEFGANVPAFLAKLWKLVDDPETNELISWTEEGASFCIRDQAQFSRKLLPMYYKHNNMASFIRQLNMYGFHKIVSADAGSLRLDKDEMEFAHQCFLRGHAYLLEHIKRKVGKSQLLTSKQIEEGKDSANGGVVVKADFMNKVLSEVKLMRGRQETVESRLTSMKQENEALWRELSLLRQKHIKQQTIVNKLIQFLVQLVQPNQRLSKRRYPLMINNVAHLSEQSNGKVTNLNSSDSNISSPLPGPTIHELDPDSILPDSDSELLPNTITLHVPGTELTEVIDSSLEPEALSLEPEALSPDPAVLESLNIPLVNSPSSVPLLEVNSSEEEMLTGEALKVMSSGPELLLAAPPFEISPAIVPALQLSKGNPTLLNRTQQAATEKIITRSSVAASTLPSTAGPSRSVVTRKSAANANKLTPEPATAGKRELRVLAPRIRRKKSTNSKDSLIAPKNENLENSVQADDLLLAAGLADSIPLTTSPVMQNNDSISGSGSVPSPAMNQLVSLPMPESPIPIINSPVSSPAPHCSMTKSIEMSPLSGPTITDVTSPLVIQPSTSSTTSEQLSPQPSPSGLLSTYDTTLACTSQGGSTPGAYVSLKSPSFNRCEINKKEDLDVHIGNMETELGQLKEFLNNSGMQLDANTLLGLFSGEETILPDIDGSNFNSKMEQTGNELMYYQPDFLDLEDMWSSDNNRSTPPPSPVDVLSELNTPVMIPTSPGFSPPAAKRRRN